MRNNLKVSYFGAIASYPFTSNSTVVGLPTISFTSTLNVLFSVYSFVKTVSETLVHPSISCKASLLVNVTTTALLVGSPLLETLAVTMGAVLSTVKL